MNILVHKSNSCFKEKILENGLIWKECEMNLSRDIQSTDDIYTEDINYILNKYKPHNKYPSNMIDREKCIFFTLKEDHIPTDKWRNLEIEVNSSELIAEKLFVAPLSLLDLITSGLVNKYPTDVIKGIAEHYWNNCFPLSDYLANKEIIKSTLKKVWKVWDIEYIPEVLYMDTVPGKLLTIVK